MGPYTCEDCGTWTFNDNHLCDKCWVAHESEKEESIARAERAAALNEDLRRYPDHDHSMDH